MLRFSAQRVDSQGTELLPGKVFKDLYRHVNIRMAAQDEAIFFDFLQLNGPTAGKSGSETIVPLSARDQNLVDDGSQQKSEDKQYSKKAIFNMQQLAKLLDYLSKEHYLLVEENYRNTEGPSKNDRVKQRFSLEATPVTGLEHLLVAIQQKIRVLFPNPE